MTIPTMRPSAYQQQLQQAAANLRTATNERERKVDTSVKPASALRKDKHWTEVPLRVKEMHDATLTLINDYDLVKPQGVEWTPELFIIEKGIDTSKTYSEVRSAIREAAKQAYVDDLTTILIENGVTDPTEQQKAFAPYDSLQEVVSMTGVNIKRIRTQVCAFASAHFKEASIASMHKGNTMPSTSPIPHVDFGPDPKLSEHFGLPANDQTINSDVEGAPTVKPVDPIGTLKLTIFKRLATTFEADTDPQIIERMKVALKASSFDDFILHYNPIEKASEIGLRMVDEYIEANVPQRATEPSPDATEGQSRSLTTTTNHRSNGNGTSHLVTGNQQWDTRVMQAQMMLNSGLMPNGVDSIEKVLTIGMMGEQLGIPMIVAVNNIDVISGKPTIKPQLMLALIRRSGQLESITINDEDDTCTVVMKRKGYDAHKETFGMDDAKRMMTKEYGKTIPLAEKHNWKSQPATMRKWRAIAAACRVVFPDHIWGFYTPEELDPDIIVAED